MLVITFFFILFLFLGLIFTIVILLDGVGRYLHCSESFFVRNPFSVHTPPKTHENRKKLGKKNKEYEVNLVDADAKQAFINLRR